MHYEDVVLVHGEPALPGPEEMVDHLHGEERAAHVMPRVVHDHHVVDGEDAGQQALLALPFLLPEVEDNEGVVR